MAMHVRYAGVALALLLAAPCHAQQLVVGTGANLLLGSSVIDAGCRDIQIDGTVDIGSGGLHGARHLLVPGGLRGGSGLIALSGNLGAAGTLLPQTGTVRIVDGCGSTESRLSGDHQFSRFSVQTSASHALVLPAGGTQFINTALELRGGVQRLLISSTSPGLVSSLSLAASGTQLVDRIDVIDVGATPAGQFLAPLEPEFYNSVDRGNSPRFFAEEALPVPTLSPIGVIGLLLLIMTIALSQLSLLTRGKS